MYRSGTSFEHLQEERNYDTGIEDSNISHIQYVLGIFGPIKEELNFFKNDSLCGGVVSDLSLYNSNVMWAVNAGHLTGVG